MKASNSHNKPNQIQSSLFNQRMKRKLNWWLRLVGLCWRGEALAAQAHNPSISFHSTFWWRAAGQQKLKKRMDLPRSGGRCLVPRSLTPFHWRPQRKTKFSSAACRSIPSTHLLSLAAHPSISFISFNQFTFWFVNWWRNERLWAHYTATDLRQQIKNYSTIS